MIQCPSFFKGVPLLFFLLLGTSGLYSQTPASNTPKEAVVRRNPPTQQPEASAVKVTVPPELDGAVLEDPVWAEIAPILGFWQTAPDEGAPASEKTEVRIVYSAQTLFIGVVCYDDDPQSTILADNRRDASLEDSDSFLMIFDTYLDRQNGFVFGTNPAGIEYDGQVSREGQGSGRSGGADRRTQSGSGGGFNLNWDASWTVHTRISEIGWSAEFAIPFRTLRYQRTRNQTWGLNFQRNIRSRNEVSYWSPLTRQYDLYRLSEAGLLNDLDLEPQRNLKLTPYLLGQVRHQGGFVDQTNWLGDGGVDLKYGLTPSLTLDVTYNTDFAQVEVDEEQINLNRFSLFFPEKRPFFLENAGLFSVGSPGEVELFFSRRIGIGPEGRVIPIVAGSRLSGKAGRLNVGFLNMQTEEVDGIAAANNFTVARMSREFPNRSSLGAIFVNRQGTGDLSGADDHNRTFGVDGRWGIGEFGQVLGYLAGTRTPGQDGSEYAFQVGANRRTPGLGLGFIYTEVAEDFNPEVGFLRRSDGYRNVDLSIRTRLRPNWGNLLELRPHATYEAYWSLDGFQETGQLHVDNGVEFKSGYAFNTAVNVTREGVVEAFEIFPGLMVPEGTYDHQELRLGGRTNQRSWLSFRFDSTIGGFFGGDRVSLGPSMRLRLEDVFTTDLSFQYNDIDLPGGSFRTNLGQARFAYAFSPKIVLESLIQYNDRADLWSMNLRFSWLQTGSNGLILVYNDTRTFGDFASVEPNRSLILKYSRVFDLLN